jgi:putative oxidoreductase
MLGGALVIEFGGALFLISGYQARVAGFVMAVYLTAVTLIFHNYWIIANEMPRAVMFMHFQKNLGLIGGLLMVAALGPGSLALGINRGPQ